jgi:hypothetical protein
MLTSVRNQGRGLIANKVSGRAAMHQSLLNCIKFLQRPMIYSDIFAEGFGLYCDALMPLAYLKKCFRCLKKNVRRCVFYFGFGGIKEIKLMQETCLKPPLFSINHHVNEHMNLNW